MIDNVTLNQLRAFVAVCDAASFSLAATRLRRAQSAISHAISSLEASLGVVLFERTGKKPELTAAGRFLLADARAVIARTEELKTRAGSISKVGALALSLAVDTYFPRAALIAALSDLQETFPNFRLQLFTTIMQGGESLVLEGRCDLAVTNADTPTVSGDRLERTYLCSVPFVTVAAPFHPLARVRGPIGSEDLERFVQLVVTAHDPQSETDRRGVEGERHWLLADLGAKQEFLVAGLGWGHMPRDRVAADIAAGRLVVLQPRAFSGRSIEVAFAVSALRGRVRGLGEERLLTHLASRTLADSRTAWTGMTDAADPASG